MRKIPIVTFINKMDRDGQRPARSAGRDRAGARHPVLSGQLAHRRGPAISGRLRSQEARAHALRRVGLRRKQGAEHGHRRWTIPSFVEHRRARRRIEQLQAELELLDVAGNAFDLERFRAGELTPVFFGSAMNNFGVEPFLDQLRRFRAAAPRPLRRRARRSSRRRPSSPPSSSRSRRTWIRSTAIASRLRASARGASSAG